MNAVELISERSALLTERFHAADDLGQLEWCGAIVEEKAHLVLVMREVVREQRPASDAETIGRLHAALDLLACPTVDVDSVAAVVRGTIRTLGGTA